MQCEATFTPTRFNVTVDVAKKTITVSHTEEVPHDIDPTGSLINIAFLGVSYLSQTLTTLYTSILGDSFLRNIDNVSARNGRLGSNPVDALRGVEEGLELLLDYFLESHGAAQVMLQNETTRADGTVTVVAVKVGNLVVVSVLAGVTGLVVLAAFEECVRLKLWKQIVRPPPVDLDFLEYKSAIVGAAKGSGSGLQEVQDWDDKSDDQVVGGLYVRGENCALVLKQKERWAVGGGESQSDFLLAN